MNRLLSPLIISLFLLTFSNPAKSLTVKTELEDAFAINNVRNSIIAKGIAACKAKKHQKTVQLLSSFLNPRRVVVSSLELEGLSCLALAYQQTGEPKLATETIRRAITFAPKTTQELADLEYTAGIIAEEQNQRAIALRHWQTARQLYLDHNMTENWAKTTLNLVKNYRELGLVNQSQQLLKELNRTKKQSL